MRLRGRTTLRIGALAAWGVVFAAAAREVEVTVLHTTDLHGRLVNLIPENDATNTWQGLLRVASLIRAARAEAPAALLVDVGDTFQGSPESLRTGGRVVLRAMAELRYDAWVTGNHEFDWGLDPLRALQADAPFACLAGNIGVRFGVTNHPLPRLQPFLLREVDGVRVAVIGMTTPAIPLWTRAEWLETLEFRRAVDALPETLAAVRAAGADVRVLAVHQGHRPRDDEANEVNLIARRFPELDAILGGHTHEIVSERWLDQTLFAQAGAHGAGLGRVTLVYDTVEKRVIRRRGEFLPATPETSPDSALEAVVGADVERAARALETTVGRARAPIPARPGRGGGYSVERLLQEAIAAAVGAEMVWHGALSDAALAAGPIRERDVWRIVPFENRIGVAELTFRDLRDILEERAARSGPRAAMTLHGAQVELDPQAPEGNRVVRLALPDGAQPHPRKRFRVAFNSYTLASGGGRFPALRAAVEKPEARLVLTTNDTRSAVREWLRRRRPVDAGAAPLCD